jgi:endonuclease/exonuclease/phosphatase family metal-dependent hydrolase
VSTKEIIVENFAPSQWLSWPPSSIRVVDWNIDRGLQLRSIIDFLGDAKADILILQEVDMNARRTHRLNIAQEIAQKLRLNYVFGREFVELTQGSDTSPAYHGQATLSRWKI